MDKGGLLVSVTNDSSYTLFDKKPGAKDTVMKGMTYDNYYTLFGNAEIRIKTGEKKVFSNFGINNAYFNNRGDGINKFLCHGNER